VTASLAPSASQLFSDVKRAEMLDGGVILPTIASLFLFGTDSTDPPPRLFTDTSEHTVFTFYFFTVFFHFLVVGSVR